MRINLPVPDLVKPKLVPEITPESVSCVPATFTVLFAPKATVPLRLDVPVLVASVPPLIVSGSAATVIFCRSKVAPLATVVLPATLPKPVAFVTFTVPAEMVVAPLKVFAPLKIKVPA